MKPLGKKQRNGFAVGLYAVLKQIDNFEAFFVYVSKMKVEMDTQELGVLLNVLEMFKEKFSPIAIVYLKDAIIAEMALPCNNPRKENEDGE